MRPIEGIEHLILEMMVEMEYVLTNLNSQTGVFTVYTKHQVAAEFFLTCGHIELNERICTTSLYLRKEQGV